MEPIQSDSKEENLKEQDILNLNDPEETLSRIKTNSGDKSPNKESKSKNSSRNTSFSKNSNSKSYDSSSNSFSSSSSDSSSFRSSYSSDDSRRKKKSKRSKRKRLNKDKTGKKSRNDSFNEDSVGPKAERTMVLRVVNLPVRPSINSLKEGLFHEFKHYGKMQSLQVVPQEDGSRICLLVYFKNSDSRKALFEANGKKIMGSIINIELADDVDPESVQQQGSIVDELNPRASRTLFIGNIDNHTNERALRRIFKDLGNIISIEIKKNPQNPPPFAFLQFDSIMGVVRSIKKMDGEILGESRIKCGWGKTMPYEVLWVSALPDFASPKLLSQEFAKFKPVKILFDSNKLRALCYFPSDEHVKNLMFEFKVKPLPIMKARIQMDYASPDLIDSFTNQLLRDKQSTTHYIVPGGLMDETAPVQLSTAPIIGTNNIRVKHESSHKTTELNMNVNKIMQNDNSEDEFDEYKERSDLEKKLGMLKKENIALMNQIINEKATSGTIDPVNIAICDGNNVLRSMEIHRAILDKPGFMVKSFGVDKKVRIAADQNTEIEFDYKMSFLDIAKELANLPEHGEIFRRNGTIELLAKNRELKAGPENFINAVQRFDIIFTVEFSMIEKVIGLLDKLVSKGQVPDPVMRNNGFGSTCHIINIDIGDFKEDASLGGELISKLCEMISALPEPDRQMSKFIKRFKKKTGTDIKHVAIQLES